MELFVIWFIGACVAVFHKGDFKMHRMLGWKILSLSEVTMEYLQAAIFWPVDISIWTIYELKYGIKGR